MIPNNQIQQILQTFSVNNPTELVEEINFHLQIGEIIARRAIAYYTEIMKNLY